MDKTYVIGICAIVVLLAIAGYAGYQEYVVKPGFEPYVVCANGNQEVLNTSSMTLCGKVNPYYGMSMEQVIEVSKNDR